MEKKLYIVSFGEFAKYRMEYEVPEGTDPLHKPNPFAEIEKELEEYLHKQLPESDDLAYFTSAKATEVYEDHREKYASYPVLDAEAISKIKEELLKEARVRMANREENLNAPYSTGDGQ